MEDSHLSHPVSRLGHEKSPQPSVVANNAPEMQGELAASTSEVDSRSTTAAHLQHLPYELLRTILASLLPSGPAVDLLLPMDHRLQSPDILKREFIFSRLTFRRCCLLCRSLRPVAQELLFRVVALRSPEDLLFFLRVLLYRVDLRLLVRTVIWAGNFSSARLHFDNTQFVLAWNIYAEFRSHAPPEDIHAAALLDISSPYKFRGRPALGLLLAMVPKIRSLFLLVPVTNDPTTMTALSSPTYQEPSLSLYETASPHPVGTVLASTPSPDPAAWAGPDGRPPYPFLQELELVILQSEYRPPSIARSEPSAYKEPWRFWRRLLDAFNRSAPRLRRVELRRDGEHGSMWDTSRDDLPSSTVQEFVFFTSSAISAGAHPAVANIVQVYPLLKSFALFTATGDRAPSLRPLRCWKETLQSLTLVTEPGANWWDPDTQTGLDEILPTLTSLQHLMTEFVWLFRKSDPTQDSLANILPTSLESLHLIDFWGDRNHEMFYPVFDVESGPFVFMGLMLIGIQAACNDRLVNLESIKIFSQCFNDNQNEDIMRKASEFNRLNALYFSEAFIKQRDKGKEGVAFNTYGELEGEIELRELWGRVVPDVPN